jgi:hypothetical protein
MIGELSDETLTIFGAELGAGVTLAQKPILRF